MEFLQLVWLADLNVSAASGLVYHRDALHVIADDSLQLHRYTLQGEQMNEISLLSGTLPDDASERKRNKPDFEALVLLPDNALLALGSGSTENRMKGSLVTPNGARTIDLISLHQALKNEFQELNLEGATVLGEHLVLAQRGNGCGGENALILLGLAQVQQELLSGILSAQSIEQIIPVSLGQLMNVNLAFTDLCVDSQGRLCFSAAAEATENTYVDGPCKGSIIGTLDQHFQVNWSTALAPAAKIEGITFVPDGRLLLVADPDCATTKGPLFALNIPRIIE